MEPNDIAVEGGLKPKAPTGLHGLAGSALQDGGYHLKIEKLQHVPALFVIMPTHNLMYMGI